MKKMKILFMGATIMASVAFLLSCSKKDDDNPKQEETNPNNNTNPNTITEPTTAAFNPNLTYGSMTDQDGNTYKTLTITTAKGTQVWMAENLRTTTYNDGTAIPHITDDSAWKNLSTPAYCNYDYTPNNQFIATYGRLYNWHAVNTGKLAPTGWHVATEQEWTDLVNLLGDSAGAKLKEAGTTHWWTPNTNASNASGLTFLPSGFRSYVNGSFNGQGGYGHWWSSTSTDSATAFGSYLHYKWVDIMLYPNYDKHYGFAVRCIKD